MTRSKKLQNQKITVDQVKAQRDATPVWSRVRDQGYSMLSHGLLERLQETSSVLDSPRSTDSNSEAGSSGLEREIAPSSPAPRAPQVRPVTMAFVQWAPMSQERAEELRAARERRQAMAALLPQEPPPPNIFEGAWRDSEGALITIRGSMVIGDDMMLSLSTIGRTCSFRIANEAVNGQLSEDGQQLDWNNSTSWYRREPAEARAQEIAQRPFSRAQERTSLQALKKVQIAVNDSQPLLPTAATAA